MHLNYVSQTLKQRLVSTSISNKTMPLEYRLLLKT